MPDYDGGFKIAAHVSGRELASLGRVRADAWQPVVGEVEAALRLADRAFHARLGTERFIVCMEAYTYWKSSATWSVLGKSGLLSERDRVPTRSLIFILKRRGYRAQNGTFRLAIDGRPANQVWFREVCLWRFKPQKWWEQCPGLMALFPLCQHGLEERPSIEYSTHCITNAVADVAQRADLLTTLAIFGRLAYPGINVLNWIGREKMKELKFFEEVMAEGALVTSRQYVLQLLKARFGPSAESEFRGVIESISDPQLLSELHVLAGTCKRMSEFRRQVDSLSAVGN